MVELNFDAGSHKVENNYEMIPEGWYQAIIIESKREPNKSGIGTKLVFCYSLLEAPYKGRTVFCHYNIDNPKEQTVKYAYDDLARLSQAVNVIHVGVTEELHGKPLMIKIKIKPAEGKWDEQNVIKGYKSIAGSAHFVATGSATPSSDGDDSPPWME